MCQAFTTAENMDAILKTFPNITIKLQILIKQIHYLI